MAKCNSDGTLVGITIATENLIPDGKIYIWNIEKNLIGAYDYVNGGDSFTQRYISH